jgi:hypothetical protein
MGMTVPVDPRQPGYQGGGWIGAALLGAIGGVAIALTVSVALGVTLAVICALLGGFFTVRAWRQAG